MDAPKDDFVLSRRWKVFLVTFCVAAPIAVLALFNDIFLILVISFAATMVLNPVVDYWEQKGVPRAASILVIYLVIAGLIAVGMMDLYAVIVTQAQSFSSSLDDQHLSALFQQLSIALSKQIPSLNADDIALKLRGALPEIAEKAEQSLSGAVNTLGEMVIVPFITFFLLNDYHKMQKAFIGSIPKIGRAHV